MPKILDNGRFRAYIYANDANPHHLPHCHVYWNGSDHASVVSLPDLAVIAGENISRAARRYLQANLDVLMAAWRRLNPCVEMAVKKSWTRSAMRFASARYVSRQGMLDVTFENGDHFLVAVETVLSKPGSVSIDWARVRLGETGDALEVPALDNVVEIPWDRIRSIADPDFRAHLADVSARRARRIGNRIQTMRLTCKLTRPELAKKIGVTAAVVAKLESGKLEPSLDMIEHLALALGKRFKDFAEE